MLGLKFTFEDQVAFAALSGDHNPIHVDPVLARRLMFGHPVVHGVHTLLGALDNCLKQFVEPLELATLKADFRTPVRVEEEVQLLCNCDDRENLAVTLVTKEGNSELIRASLVSSGNSRSMGNLKLECPQERHCRLLSDKEIPYASGKLELYLDMKMSNKLFPNLIRLLPPTQIAALLATTRLVGMQCPGLHSIFSGLDLQFGEAGGDPLGLAYQVSKFDTRFSSICMNVQAPRMKGTIRAFVRPAPKEQSRFRDLRGQVDGGEFAGQQALVIGGSRGLGEATTKLLAAGGAKVRFSYYAGSEDAHQLVEEITSGGGYAAAFRFDVLGEPGQLVNGLGDHWGPTHLYYFATPFISVATRGHFSSELFRQFCDYYVGGFLKTVQTIRNMTNGLNKIFYPSSIFVEELPLNMGEYAAAKTAGEILCTFLEKAYVGLKIHKPRLPKAATDQTVSLLPGQVHDPIPLLLEHLRYLRDA